MPPQPASIIDLSFQSAPTFTTRVAFFPFVFTFPIVCVQSSTTLASESDSTVTERL